MTRRLCSPRPSSGRRYPGTALLQALTLLLLPGLPALAGPSGAPPAPSAAGTPAAGTPAAGTPASGTPASGTPASGETASRAETSGAPALYVETLSGGGDSAGSARVWTPMLCHALATSAQDVICATDVEQLLRHASTLAAMGASPPGLRALEERLAQVTLIVRGRIVPGEGQAVRLELSLHEKDPRSQGVRLLAGAALARAAGDVAASRAAEDIGRITRALEPRAPAPMPLDGAAR